MASRRRRNGQCRIAMRCTMCPGGVRLISSSMRPGICVSGPRAAWKVGEGLMLSNLVCLLLLWNFILSNGVLCSGLS